MTDKVDKRKNSVNGHKGEGWWCFTPEKKERVKHLASLGMTKEAISTAIGLHPQRFSGMCKRVPELEDAYCQGVYECQLRDAQALTNIANDPAHPKHFDAVKFRLARVAKWSERQEVEHNHTYEDERLREVSGDDILEQLDEIARQSVH